VCEFGFTVSLEGVVIGLGGEVERIEESYGFESTDKVVDVCGRCSSSNWSGFLLGERRKGGGGTGGSNKGGSDEFHFDDNLFSVWKLVGL